MASNVTPINMLVTLNSNYVAPLTVMLSSLMRSNPSESFVLYVAHSSLTDEDFMKIRSAVDIRRCTVVSVPIDGRRLKDAPVLDRITKETYYRLIAHEYLPEDVKKVLYIDPDTVIINALRPLYDIELKDNLLMGATHVKKPLNRLTVKWLHMQKGTWYINAGVMLMNLEGMRNTITSEEIFRFITENAKRLYLGDQDVINALFSDRILLADACIFNLDEKTRKQFSRRIDNAWVNKNTVIVHFNGKYKPWKPGYKGVLKGFYDREVHCMNTGMPAVSRTSKAG